MNDELNSFWSWFGLDSYQYINKRSGNPKEEFMYPYWDRMLEKAKEAIRSNSTDIALLNNILMVLALDNEREELLDYLSSYDVSQSFCVKLIEAGLSHPQPNARWQIAVLARRRLKNDALPYLNVLMNDVDCYVRKRTQNEVLLLKSIS